MNKLSTILIALYLLAGCSSGGGTSSSGQGVGNQTTDSNLLLTSSVKMRDVYGGDGYTVSHDVYVNLCNGAEIQAAIDKGEDPPVAITESGIKTAIGEFTVNSTDLSDNSGLTPVEFFPEGITFTSYKVTHVAANSFAPRLHDQTFYETFSVPNGSSTIQYQVILLDLDILQEVFRDQSSSSIASYNLTVQLFGQEFDGSPISVTAQTFVEYGNFNRCDA